MSRATHLKIKIHTLADEARHIRREERKALSAARKCAKTENQQYEVGHRQDWADLHDHRVGIVRSTSRSCLLAYGFLRGLAYSDMEYQTRTFLDFSAIFKIVKRFGSPEDLARWSSWQQEAIGYLKVRCFSNYHAQADMRGAA
jgi:hypothetical protein